MFFFYISFCCWKIFHRIASHLAMCTRFLYISSPLGVIGNVPIRSKYDCYHCYHYFILHKFNVHTFLCPSPRASHWISSNGGRPMTLSLSLSMDRITSISFTLSPSIPFRPVYPVYAITLIHKSKRKKNQSADFFSISSVFNIKYWWKTRFWLWKSKMRLWEVQKNLLMWLRIRVCSLHYLVFSLSSALIWKPIHIYTFILFIFFVG